MSERWQYVKPTLDTQRMVALHEATSRIFQYNFTLRNSPFENDPVHLKLVKQIVGTRGPYYLRLAKLNPFHRHAVIKDPTATLMTEYLHVHFGVQPVVVIRHPLSFIASLKRVNWWPDIKKIIDQKHLFADYLLADQDLWRSEWKSPLEGAAAHWRLIHMILQEQASRYPDWKIIKLEEISAQPVDGFKQLYNELSLPWSGMVERRILKMTQGAGSGEVRSNRVQDLSRNSAKIFELRKNSLSAKERRLVYEVVKDVSQVHYCERSFGLT